MPLKPGPMELIIILVIVMMIFGVGRLPQVGNAIGRSIKEFRKGQEEDAVAAEVTEVEPTNAYNKVEG